jgi:hypothetical protein
MRRDFQVAWACAISAARGFRWVEYAPFGWILAAQIAFLLLAVRLESPIGMATAGDLTRRLLGDAALHYPDFFLYLPSVASIVEAFLYMVPGAALIPLALIRMQRRLEPATARTPTGAWLARATPPTLLGWITQAAVLLAWQSFVQFWPSRALAAALPGDGGFIASWVLQVLGAYAVAALFLYIPIVAVASAGAPLLQTVREGLGEGLLLFRHTWFFIVCLSLPALPFLLLAQLRAAAIVNRLQPEMVAVLLGVYAALMSVANYLIFSAARRLHAPVEEEPE